MIIQYNKKLNYDDYKHADLLLPKAMKYEWWLSYDWVITISNILQKTRIARFFTSEQIEKWTDRMILEVSYKYL